MNKEYSLEKRKNTLWYFLTNKTTRVWMEGYYAAQIDLRKGLSDIPLIDLDKRYLIELAKRAKKELDNLQNSNKKVVK